MDIFVIPAASPPIRLWSKHSGLDTAGFDWLMEKRKGWYSYREPGRTLKAGDRVAVFGKGIGVVASAGTSDVHVLMWNKVSLQIPRKRVVWNRCNWRWEADGSGAFARCRLLSACPAGCSVTAITDFGRLAGDTADSPARTHTYKATER